MLRMWYTDTENLVPSFKFLNAVLLYSLGTAEDHGFQIP